jgi:hypothetical protein
MLSTFDPYDGIDVKTAINKIMGWIGDDNIASFILIVLVFKFFLIEYMTNSVKAFKVDEYSEFNLVYTKAK